MFHLLLSLVLPDDAPGSAQATFDGKARHAIVTQLAQTVEDNYVFPDVARKVAANLRERDAKHAYDGAATPDALAAMLADDMRSTGKDLHFNVWPDPDYKPSPTTSPSAETLAQQREQAERMAGGIFRAERLPGNVGYLDLRGFEPVYYSAANIDAAMALLKNTEAIIIDLRKNGGGDGDTVTYLLSHFFGEGDPKHLNDMVFRKDHRTEQHWTTTAVAVRYTRPVYVLTSKHTFSAAEECAYDFQTQKRATIVGETTGGGANPGDVFPLGQGLVALISTGQSINPITHTNWEGVGVKPDMAVKANRALDIANAKILREIVIPKSNDARVRVQLSAEAERLERGEAKKDDM